MLAVIIVIFWCAVFTFPYFLIIKKCWLRVTKVSELIGLDVAQQTLGKSDLKNFIQFVITEYFPENAGEYLLKKKRLLEMAKKGKKQAKRQLTKEELIKIKEMLDQEIREVYGSEAAFFDRENENDGDEDANHDSNSRLNNNNNRQKQMTFQEPLQDPLRFGSANGSPNKLHKKTKTGGANYQKASRLDTSEQEIEMMKVNPKDKSYKQVHEEDVASSRGLGSAMGPGKRSEEKKRRFDDEDDVVFSF